MRNYEDIKNRSGRDGVCGPLCCDVIESEP